MGSVGVLPARDTRAQPWVYGDTVESAGRRLELQRPWACAFMSCAASRSALRATFTVFQEQAIRMAFCRTRCFSLARSNEFLSNLDFLILAMPLTKTTRGIVGERELQSLPRSAFVLNPARGPLIQEQALLKALESGWIAGAAIDTHYYYPMPANHPLWRFPNVIMTPHISGSSKSTHYIDRSWDIFVSNVKRYLAGEQLLNELSSAQLSGE